MSSWHMATHQHLLPFITQTPSRFSALVRIDTTSDPAFGSDIASEPMCSPVSSLGRYLSRCAGAARVNPVLAMELGTVPVGNLLPHRLS